ncbi:MAG: hypothetical protein PHI02_09270 [Sulfurovaceae bacterium]|nr:hypothetical protein [Sulfurovaceae bacterium]MDD5360441.1 hypothetical protein [Sulfurovaceae bacterium]
MIQYLRIKQKANTNKKYIIHRKRSAKFSKDLKEIYVPKTKSIFLFGLAGAGKTKEFEKIYKNRFEIWTQKQEFIRISCILSLSDILNENVNQDDKNSYLLDTIDDDEYIINSKELNKQYQQINLLVQKARKAICFIDDIDKLSGKKLEVIKDIIKNSKQIILTASEKKNINKTILLSLERKKSYEIELNTDASYDITNYLIAFVMIICVVFGLYELAGFTFALRYMMKEKGK